MNSKETLNNAQGQNEETAKQNNSEILSCYDLDSDWDAQYDEIKKNYHEYIRRKNEIHNK